MRPKFLNLFLLFPRMSITAKVSILHRLTGVILFFTLPYITRIIINFHYYLNQLTNKVFFVIWGLIFFLHLVFTIRYFFTDAGMFLTRTAGKVSAYFALVIGIIIWFITYLCIFYK